MRTQTRAKRMSSLWKRSENPYEKYQFSVHQVAIKLSADHYSYHIITARLSVFLIIVRV